MSFPEEKTPKNAGISKIAGSVPLSWLSSELPRRAAALAGSGFESRYRQENRLECARMDRYRCDSDTIAMMAATQPRGHSARRHLLSTQRPVEQADKSANCTV
jgi:hypothetical protein